MRNKQVAALLAEQKRKRKRLKYRVLNREALSLLAVVALIALSESDHVKEGEVWEGYGQQIELDGLLKAALLVLHDELGGGHGEIRVSDTGQIIAGILMGYSD